METIKKTGKTRTNRSNSTGQYGGSSSQTAFDNRSSTKKQLEIQAMADRRIGKRNIKKTLKNIFTLGIRKAYVNHKRKNRDNNVYDFQDTDLQIDESIESFIKAYEASRFYHSSRGGFTDSIDKHGLLTDQDRRANSEVGDVGGYSGIGGVGGEFSGHEKQGVFMSAKKHRAVYKDTYSAPSVRLFLTKDQAAKKNQVIESYTKLDEPVGPGLYRDGSGGLISRISIPAEQVSKQDISDLLNGPKLEGILRTIASHYAPGTAPSLEVLKQLLTQAIGEDDPQTRRRRLSDAQLDNID